MWQFYWKHSNTHAMTSLFFGIEILHKCEKEKEKDGYNSNLVQIIINPFIFLVTNWKPTIEI